jgi:hypothetical protein
VEVTLLAAPDAAEEVRSVVRRLLAQLEDGRELRRVAIAYLDRDPYGPLVRDTLDAAGIPCAGIDGRALSHHRPRALQRVLDLLLPAVLSPLPA